MDWYNIHITNEENVNRKQYQVQDAFKPIIMLKTAPKEFALFSKHNTEDRSADVYMSPHLANVTSRLLATFKATPCEKPGAGSVGLLVGDQNALEFFDL